MKIIKEIQITKSLGTIKTFLSKNYFEFVYPKERSDNNTGEDITYKVTFSSFTKNSVNIHTTEGKGAIAISKCTSVVFSNSLSGMSRMSSNMGVSAMVVYGTVAKCVKIFLEQKQPNSMSFFPAHDYLFTPYKILCKEIANASKGEYLWASKLDNEAGAQSFYILKKSVYNKWLEIRHLKNVQNN